MRLITIGSLLLLVALQAPQTRAAADFQCLLGDNVAASLGDGVILHSCSWEQTPGNFVRTGPLQLIKNGILILQLQTDSNGKLQGEFRAWDDSGVLIESGQYLNGLKEGEWRYTDKNGLTRVTIYSGGMAVSP
jgi:hypothetical protein